MMKKIVQILKLYSYNVFVCSYNPNDGPNENPEVELPLTAGEYIYVYGDTDDDGFYEGVILFYFNCRFRRERCRDTQMRPRLISTDVLFYRRADGR